MSQRVATKLSSKGQVVVPEEVRKRLGLEAGDQFVVVGEGDVVVLKSIEKLAMSRFRSVVSKAKPQARTIAEAGGGPRNGPMHEASFPTAGC